MPEKLGAIQSVINALEILEAVAELQPVGVSELSRFVKLPKSSVQRSLSTLGAAGWIQQTPSDQTRWQLTALMLSLSLRSFAEYSLKDVAEPAMRELSARTSETIHLLAITDSTVGNGSGVVVHRIDSTHAVRTFVPIGTITPLAATAAGQAILAHLPEDDIERIVTSGLPSYTPHTVTDPDALRHKLEKVREVGYAQNYSEWRDEVAAVAAPIFSASDRIVGAITISIPVSRFDVELVPQYGAWVKELAAHVRPISVSDASAHPPVVG